MPRSLASRLALLLAGAAACTEQSPGMNRPTDHAGDAGSANASGGDAAASLEADAGSHVVGTIYSGVPWFDTGGNLVNAHGVGFIQVGDTYYMVGEQRSGANDTYSGAPINAEDTFTGVSMYATKDFANWTFVGTVVEPIPGTILAPLTTASGRRFSSMRTAVNTASISKCSITRATRPCMSASTWY